MADKTRVPRGASFELDEAWQARVSGRLQELEITRAGLAEAIGTSRMAITRVLSPNTKRSRLVRRIERALWQSPAHPVTSEWKHVKAKQEAAHPTPQIWKDSIRTRLESLGWSQSDLAKELNKTIEVTAQAVSYVLSDKCKQSSLRPHIENAVGREDTSGSLPFLMRSLSDVSGNPIVHMEVRNKLADASHKLDLRQLVVLLDLAEIMIRRNA